MSTITDVANAAGVSVATVSRALRGLDRVSPQTRARVQQVAAELNYTASPTATSLASGRTRVIGVVAPFLTRWFFATLVSSIEKTLRARHHHVLLFDLEDDRFDRRLTLTQDMLWKRVDAIVTLNLPLADEEVSLLERLDLPVVAIGTPVPGRPCVLIDDALAVRTATEHLIGLGHEQIAYVGTVPDNAAHERTPRARLGSFLATMAEHGLTAPDRWLVSSDWTAASAAADCAPLLSGDDRPTAVVAGSDEMAIGVLQAARRLDLRVPEDVSVVGIDDYVLADVMDLTTVRQDVEAQGARAAALLLGLLLDREPLPPHDTVLPTELIVRRTTAAPPARA